MRLFRKARQILRTHGFAGFAHRAARHVWHRIAAEVKAAAQREAWENLIGRIGQTRPVFFPRHQNPIVSVVVPVFNNVRYTAACLNAVLRELDAIPCEVIVVDDGSTDGTAEYLSACSGLKVLTHDTNLGVAASINDGVGLATGRYLHLLNNDTIVTPGWMRALLRVFECRAHVAAVGSQLRAPDGSVSEAGGLVWRDGNASNYGRGRTSRDAGISFPREVDYCSAASLMVRADVFRQVGGFSQEFAPAYYEDVDLCFRLRRAGYSVLYQPDSVVVHFEAATAGKDTSTGIKRFQSEHRYLFATKWATELAKHFPPDADLIERAARRLAGKRTVLVLDSFIPFDDRSAGGRRLLAIMRLMRDLDWHVIFIADDGGEYEPYVSRARRAGIEVIPHRGAAFSTIRDLPVNVDVAWVARPDLLQKYMPELRRRTKAKIIYDTVDLHFLRLQRAMAVTGRETSWEAMRDLEYDLIRRSDCTIVTSQVERDVLGQVGVEAYVIPIIEQPVRTPTAYSTRHGLLFLANYTHDPNVDAATWLVSEIMPLVWERIPNIQLTLAGADPTPAIQRLAGEHIRVTGHVPDVRPLFENARLFVAPLRYGAGMKGKIVQSLAHGLPVVTTLLGGEGIGLIDGLNAMLADDPRAIADRILRAYSDEALWSALADGARKAAQRFTPAAVRTQVELALEAALEQRVEVGIDISLPTHPA